MARSIKTLQDALALDLKRLYNGETQLKEVILSILPKIHSEPLKSLLQQYSESADHKRLKIDRMFSYLTVEPDAQASEVINTLADELRNKAERASEDILDLLIIPSLQQICYYKISAYRTAMTLALELELDVVADLLHQIIEWERKTDCRLMDLAYHEFSKGADATL